MVHHAIGTSATAVGPTQARARAVAPRPEVRTSQTATGVMSGRAIFSMVTPGSIVPKPREPPSRAWYTAPIGMKGAMTLR